MLAAVTNVSKMMRAAHNIVKYGIVVEIQFTPRQGSSTGVTDTLKMYQAGGERSFAVGV